MNSDANNVERLLVLNADIRRAWREDVQRYRRRKLLVAAHTYLVGDVQESRGLRNSTRECDRGEVNRFSRI